jgi:N-glycosylase/DNA lyase
MTVIRQIDFFDPKKIALSGQAFRIHSIDDTHTETVAYGRYLQIAKLGEDRFAFSCTEKEFNDIWVPYFDLDTDYIKAIKDTDKNDIYLQDAISYGYGIRILRQDVFEATISYIISQRRSIPSITTCVDRLSEFKGKKVKIPELDEHFVKPIKEDYYSFPTVNELKSITAEELDGIGAGYRTPYILRAIEDFSSGKILPAAMHTYDDDLLYEALTSMYGVGTKVANCIMLFAFHRTGRFPVDVWVQRIQDKYYNGSFDCSRYPQTAGIMQQFMFYYERLEDSHK